MRLGILIYYGKSFLKPSLLAVAEGFCTGNNF